MNATLTTRRYLLGAAAAFGLAASIQPLAAQEKKVHRRIVLEIHAVKCIDESNGKYMERIGGDEIVLSGIAVDATGRATRVPTLRVGHFKKDGEIKTFSPPRDFMSFDLTTGPEFPRTLQTYLVLVERDEGGGFGPVVDRLVAGVNAGTGLPPTRKGSARALSRRDIEPVLMAAAANDMKKVARLLGMTVTKKLGDDIFPPQLVKRTLKGPTALFGGKDARSPEQHAVTKAHGGKYEIRYSWRLES